MDDFNAVPPGSPESDKTSPEPNDSADGREAAASEHEPAQLFLWPADELPPTAPPSPAPPPPRDPPWTLFDLVGFVAFAATSYLVATLFAVSMFSLLRNRMFPNMRLEDVVNQTPWALALQSGWELLCVAFIYLLITTKYRRDFRAAIRWIKAPRALGAYLAGGGLLALIAEIVSSFFPEKHLPMEKLFSSTESAYLLTVFGICIAPFVEELVFRGFFYPVFERLWGFLAAVVITAILFAAIHAPQLGGGPEEVATIFVVGIVFSYVRGRTGSLVPSILMHIAYNTVLFASLFVTTNGFRTFKS